MTDLRRGRRGTTAGLLAVLGLFNFVTPLYADVLPPEAVELRVRFMKTAEFDEADQFCQGKSPEAACEMPGDAFEGGGRGSCQRHLYAERQKIALQCDLSTPLDLDRGVTPPLDDRWMICILDKENQDPAFKADCAALLAAKPVDRFCSGKSAGADCTVEATSGSGSARFSGTCEQIEETASGYRYGRREVSRTILSCEPAKKVSHEFSPVGFWDRLWQHF